MSPTNIIWDKIEMKKRERTKIFPFQILLYFALVSFHNFFQVFIQKISVSFFRWKKNIYYTIFRKRKLVWLTYFRIFLFNYCWRNALHVLFTDFVLKAEFRKKYLIKLLLSFFPHQNVNSSYSQSLLPWLFKLPILKCENLLSFYSRL